MSTTPAYPALFKTRNVTLPLDEPLLDKTIRNGLVDRDWNLVEIRKAAG